MLSTSTQIEKARQKIGILVSKLKPGTRLPSYQEMKKKLGINQHALDIVYDELSQDGALERRYRSGIYVINPFKEACFLYIANSDEMLSETEGIHVRLNLRFLNKNIERIFPGSYIQVVLLNSGHKKINDNTLKHILTLKRNQRILGVFSSNPIIHKRSLDSFDKWDLPCIDANNKKNPFTIMFQNNDSWWIEPLHHLKKEGWQTITMVSWMLKIENYTLPAHFAKSPRRIKRVNLRPGPSGNPEQEGENYIRMQLKSRVIPDAFIIEDDYVCRGMIQGALKEGVRLEEECAIITLFNKNAPISSTRELTRVEARWDKVADIQLHLMQKAINGAQPPETLTTIVPDFIIGRTSRHIDYFDN